jgi:hypothetical protein
MPRARNVLTSRILFIAVIVMCMLSTAYAQPSTPTDTSGFEFLPRGVVFPPLIANPQEPRVGVRKELGTSQLKLDIGSTVDLLEYTINDHSRIRMGAELFTYALTTSAQGLRLQVDAVDGFFGGHITFQTETCNQVLTLRLRLMHLSAHLLDGHYDLAAGQWKDNRLPIPFTRDFGELLAAYGFPLKGISVLVYSGIDYATLVRPEDVQRLASLHGIQLDSGDKLGTAFGKPFAVYVADNLSFAGVPAYTGTNIAEVGVHFGSWSSTGLKLYVNYASGLEFFSQYYNVRRSQWGSGFTIDFW